MESEAHEARGRWPLLGMIDPRKVEVSATRRSPGPALTTSAAPPGIADSGRAPGGVGEGAPGAVAAPGGGVTPRDRSQAALRRSAPLFTRSPRRDMAQALDEPVPEPPDGGAFRFSQPPDAQAAQADLEEVAPSAPAPRVRASVPDTAPLRKLFGAATVPDVSHAQPSADTDPEGRLDRLFGRLRESGSTNSTNSTGTTSNTKPAQDSGVDSKLALAPARPALSRE